jgi:hypothetical protein
MAKIREWAEMDQEECFAMFQQVVDERDEARMLLEAARNTAVEYEAIIAEYRRFQKILDSN